MAKTLPVRPNRFPRISIPKSQELTPAVVLDLLNKWIDDANKTFGKSVSDLFIDAHKKINTGDIADDAVTAAKIAADAVGSSEIAPNAVGASELADNAVDAAAIAANAVTTSKILDANVTAAKILDGVVGVAKMANDFPFTWAWNSAALTLVTATDTLLTFDSEVVDIDGMHSTVSNTSRLTAVRRGYYLLLSMLTFAANGTGHRYAYHMLNNTTVISYDIRPAVTGLGVMVQPWCIYPLAVGDYVETRAFQNSTVNLNISRIVNYSPFFFAVWLRPYP